MKTTETTGGKLFGFGSSQNDVSATVDRHVWHHVVATLGYSGMALDVDGVKVDSRTDRRRGGNDTGFWRLGGDKLDGWPGTTGLDRYPAADLDEVAIYDDELSADAVASHFHAAVG